MDKRLKNILVIDIETVTGEKDFSALNPEMKDLWLNKAQFLDLKDKTAEEFYFEKASIYSEFGKVIVIGVGIFFEKSNQTCLRVTSFNNHNEKKLLDDFKAFIELKFDQSNLLFCAHNGKEFDYPYLCRRMIVNEIPIPLSLDLRNKKPWEVNHIDTLEMWKFGDRKNYTSLKLLTHILNIPSSKDDIDGSKVNHEYYFNNGLSHISNYCKKDVIATSQLFLKLSGFPLIAENNIQIV